MIDGFQLTIPFYGGATSGNVFDLSGEPCGQWTTAPSSARGFHDTAPGMIYPDKNDPNIQIIITEEWTQYLKETGTAEGETRFFSGQIVEEGWMKHRVIFDASAPPLDVSGWLPGVYRCSIARSHFADGGYCDEGCADVPVNYSLETDTLGFSFNTDNPPSQEFWDARFAAWRDHAGETHSIETTAITWVHASLGTAYSPDPALAGAGGMMPLYSEMIGGLIPGLSGLSGQMGVFLPPILAAIVAIVGASSGRVLEADEGEESFDGMW